MLSLLLWTIFFLAASFQGFFLVFLILLKRNEGKANRYSLGLFVFVYSLMLLFWVGYWNDLHYSFPLFNFLYNPIPFLLGPSLYLYFSITIVGVFDRKNLIHFIPFLLTLFYFLAFYHTVSIDKFTPLGSTRIDSLLFSWTVIESVIYPLHSLSFLFYSFLTYQLLQKSKNGSHEKTSKNDNTYLKYMHLLFTIHALFSCLIYGAVQIFDLPLFLDYLLGIFTICFIYGIGYIGFTKPIFDYRNASKREETYAASSLKLIEVDHFKQKLLVHLEINKPFLNDQYKKNELAKELDIKSHHLSELLNKYLNKSFSDLINSYRVKEAQKMLRDKKLATRTLESIGYEAGFNSKATFYTAFKKTTGLTPGEYSNGNRPTIQN